MFVHPDPKRVAIIGGDECSTFREVSKHNTVNEVFIVESEMGDSSSRVDYLSCFHEQTALHDFKNKTLSWFHDSFKNKSSSANEPFDVIVMDVK